MDKQNAVKVSFLTIDDSQHGQRIDNFLFTKLKGVPKSRIYKAIRKGEIRVNKKRIKPEYKLQERDQIRLPPLRVATPQAEQTFASQKLAQKITDNIIFEDNDFIVLNKPAGIAVHGGSGVSFGVIEALRQVRPKQKFMELVHRLDRETSGCLLIAKKSSLLREVHALLLAREVQKSYLLLVSGRCNFDETEVAVPLKKNILKSGERIVVVATDGKPSKTIFRVIKRLDNMTLLEAKPITGRTHQIRVHASHLGHPILGDEKYGNEEANKRLRQQGYQQLCLHSSLLAFYLQSKQQWLGVCALLREPWRDLFQGIR